MTGDGTDVKGPKKGKMLEGAPRTGRWTKETPERQRVGGRHRGSIILLGVIALLVLGGVGAYGAVAYSRLQKGIVDQYQRHQRRSDWIALERLPPRVVNAFLTVVDTTSFQRVPPHAPADRPLLTRDLLVQVHRLDRGVGDQAMRVMMVPLLERSLPRGELLELYLNRIHLGRTGEWEVYGVRSASQEFFGKDPRALTVGEAATLAGLLLPPKIDDPEASPGAVGARRNEVLRRMLAGGDIDETVYRAALAEPLGFQPGVDYAPMTRPVGWDREPDVIRLPPELRPTAADSAGAAARSANR